MLEKLIVLFAVVCVACVQGCSNIIVSPEASSDGSSIVAYNADSSTLFGSLYHYPAADHVNGSMREIFDWDSGRYLGHIPEAEHTYNVVGNVNEYGVIIGETTYGGIESLQSQSIALVDYGSLIWITLQRSRTAREAIKTIGDLMNTYGYASEGESFSIGDQRETWIMEIIGKGEYEKGAVWVAVKVPAGHICAHANQARIRTFALNDPENCQYSPDVVTFARKLGLYSASARDEDFSFSDTYDPVTFSGARICDGRVWSVFGSVMGAAWAEQYVDYALGHNLTNRMPLFVKPPVDSKLSVLNVMALMRSHFEGTQLDMAGKVFTDAGAAFDNNPNRAHPLTWSSAVQPDGSQSSSASPYLNERPIATQQTGWNFVAQSRLSMPRQLAALLWFGVDDSATTVRFPVYGGATRVADCFAGKGAQDGVVPPMLAFSFDSAFHVFNMVANWAYSRWDLIYPDVLAEITRREAQYVEEVKTVDIKAVQLNVEEGAASAVEYVTQYSVTAGNQLVKDWVAFFGTLMVKFRDGYVITANADSKNCGCSSGNQAYPQAWYDRIVTDTKSHYLVAESETTKLSSQALKPVSKIALMARR